MPQPPKLVKATLTEMWPGANDELEVQDIDGNRNGAKVVEVQFNPQTLKINFSNQAAGTDQPKAPVQFVGKGTTKLTMELVFDATLSASKAAADAGGDVRNITANIAYFMTPKPYKLKKSNVAGDLPPGVQLSWGSFLFKGVMDSMDETLELFSADGIPLRATVGISISKQEIQFLRGPAAGLPGLPGGVGTQPLEPAPAGASLQQIAAKAGLSDWQSIASANGIENPRLLQPGMLIDLSVPTRG